MKILHTSDIHLREQNDERWKGLETLIEVGKKEEIDLFLISGDLFDKDIHAEGLKGEIRGLFSNTGFKIVIVRGNHDMNSYSEGMLFGEDVEIITDIRSPFELDGVRIFAIPFEPIDGEEIIERFHSIKSKLTEDRTNILLYHGELTDATFVRDDFGDEGDKRYMPVKLSYFNGLNLKYVLSGHFHSRFNEFKLENGGYFVYPGSPVSITKKETGRRKVNMFEVGGPPEEYLLNTPHFEEVVIEFNPIGDKNPTVEIEDSFHNIHKNARILISLRGFINGEAIGMTEKDIIVETKRIAGEHCQGDRYEIVEQEFRDIRHILEDELFRGFLEKLENSDNDEDRKREMRQLSIRAMMEARS